MEEQKSSAKTIRESTKQVVDKLLNLFGLKKDVGELTEKSNSKEIITGIHKLLVETEAQRKSDFKTEMSSVKDEEKETEKRHGEILKALTVRRKPVKRVKKEEVKKKPTEKTGERKATPVEGGKTTPPNVPAPRPAPPVSTTPVVPKPSISTTPSVKIATGGLLAAAGMSVRGETGAVDLGKVSGDVKKVGQVVPNDPKPGVSSYGIFGINSGGSVQNFVADNPQFGLVGKPASKEFDDSWKRNAETRTKEFYQAQLDWYGKYVYNPTKREMQKLLPVNIGSSDKVVTYMADRRNQMGKVGETSAIKYAIAAKTPEEFITKIAEHDASDEFIKKAFPTYLATHGLDRIKGLQKRVEMRKQMSLQAENTGESLNSTSNENKNIKNQLNKDDTPMNKTINNVGVSESRQEQTSPKAVDDRSPLERVTKG